VNQRRAKRRKVGHGDLAAGRGGVGRPLSESEDERLDDTFNPIPFLGSEWSQVGVPLPRGSLVSKIGKVPEDLQHGRLDPV
jgi:hypothetical protein